MAEILTGLDRLLGGEATLSLAGCRYALLAHGASVTADLRPAHLALAAAGMPPTVLLGPEHGYYGVEQDMIPAHSQPDPWTGVPIVSLYGDSEGSLKPQPEVFRGLDRLVIDLQDVGARYYTYAATAVWAAEAAISAGADVWVLDRPNPLGGEVIEGNRPLPGYDSFVGAFDLPVRHGLTLAELVALEARRRGWPAEALRLVPMAGWARTMSWPDTGRPWIAPSPNMPSYTTAVLYPGLCLVEATTLSEGRGTTRPFQLVGAPAVDPVRLAARLNATWGHGQAGGYALPTYFRPQFQKHAGLANAGVELVVTDPARWVSYRAGVELLAVCREVAGGAWGWRPDPYEFVIDRPAIDLLTGGPECRERLEAGADLGPWFAKFAADEAAFRRERADILLYPERPA